MCWRDRLFAKMQNVFAVHGVNEAGKPGKPELVRPSVARAPNYMRWWRRCRRA